MPSDTLSRIYEEEVFREGSPAHQALEDKFGFSYRTLLGELMYAYVTARPDISYAVTTLSKFSSAPGSYHFHLLRGIANYLKATINWGIRFKRPRFLQEPYPGAFNIILHHELPEESALTKSFGINIDTPKLIGFVDAAHANELIKRRSTTGLVYTFMGGAVVYQSKTQSITAGSSTEAEFIAAHSAGKIARYLRRILSQIGFEQSGPTPIFIDNEPALKIINDNSSPTERVRHMDICYFQIQDWAHRDIVMVHIPGTLNPSDDATKPLGSILHCHYCRRIMGHYNTKKYG